jgi:hypothetical protein
MAPDTAADEARVPVVIHVPTGQMFPAHECNVLSLSEHAITALSRNTDIARRRFAAFHGRPVSILVRLLNQRGGGELH